MLPRHHPDRIRIAFDDHRLVAYAGLILPATLALRLGLPQLILQCLDLGNAPEDISIASSIGQTAPARSHHRLTIPWGSRLDALRLRARSRIPKARAMPWRSTLGDGCSSCLRRA